MQPLALGWDPDALARSLQVGLAATPPGSLAWVQGNHDDQSRAATRFGGGEAGRRRSLAFATLVAALPGLSFTYQGEELGLEDGKLSLDQMQDPLAVRNAAPQFGRDRVRTPIPWQPGMGYGFTTHPRPWLPVGPRIDSATVAVQRADATSMLGRFRALLGVRRSLPAAGPVAWMDSGPVIAYRRGEVLVALNAGATPARFEPPGRSTVVYSTKPVPRDKEIELDLGVEPAVTLVPEEAVILRLNHEQRDHE